MELPKQIIQYSTHSEIESVKIIWKMAQSAPLILRLLATSVTAASRAGKIIKDVMSKGELGIVEKVSLQELMWLNKLLGVQYTFATIPVFGSIIG